MQIVQETTDKSMMTYLMGMGTPIPIGVYIWLIEGATKNVLVDTGCSADYLNSIGFPSEQVSTQEEELEKVGLTVDEVDVVVLTHLHSDHAKDAEKFKNATFVVQQSELDFAADPHPIQAGWFADLPRNRVRAVDGDEEILEGIRVVHTPGHSPGGQSVLIESESGTVGLCGLCTIRDNLYPPEELQQMGVRAIAPGIHTDAAQAYDSLIKLLELSDQAVALHDPSYKSVERIP
jgi:glyoxylase-like metal-dependent hydrolase (beta-lactamase superfamily II)